jgi:hypothetical protein
MDVIEGRGVKALVYNPNKYERVSISPNLVHGNDPMLISPSSANATIRSPTTPSKTCRRKASSTTCSRLALPAALLRRSIPRWVSMEASKHNLRAIVEASLACFSALRTTTVRMAVALWAMSIWVAMRLLDSIERELF